jgi:CHAT domain-containing protein
VRRIETQGGLASPVHIKAQVPLPETADELCTVARAVKADPREIRLGAMIGNRKVGRAEALRRAMRALIYRGSAEQAHPAYWAPFVVVGEGAPGR